MKNIACFSDGTWNEPGGRKTNVLRLCEAAKEKEVVLGIKVQSCKYDPGVGTGKGIDKAIGGATGWGISRNIRDVYRHVAAEYQPGDSIFLFGFSRGAYTARSAAGMIRKCGVLKNAVDLRDDSPRLVQAFDFYRGEIGPDDPQAVQFRLLNSHGETPIHFVGVWDTVGALGIPGTLGHAVSDWTRSFHDVQLSSKVRHAYHAVALDERRLAFQPALWSHPRSKTPREPGTSFEQRWFAGVHSDVGGGYPACGLSDQPLEWMAKMAEDHGLHVDWSSLVLKPDLTTEINDSQSLTYRAMGVVGKLRQLFGQNRGLAIEANGELVRALCSNPEYACTLDPSVADKMAKDASYRPTNTLPKPCVTPPE